MHLSILFITPEILKHKALHTIRCLDPEKTAFGFNSPGSILDRLLEMQVKDVVSCGRL